MAETPKLCKHGKVLCWDCHNQVQTIEQLNVVIAAKDARIAELLAENESLRKDAARMDWIEENYSGDGGFSHFNMRIRFDHDIEDSGGSARGIIDAALANPGNDNGEG